MAKKTLETEIELPSSLPGMTEEHKSIALVLLGLVAIIAVVGLVLLLVQGNSTNGALTYAERWGYGAQAWNTEGYNCGTPTGCVAVDESKCGPGYVPYYVDGWQQACLDPRQAVNVPSCGRTTMRMSSLSCNVLEPAYREGRCVCP